MQMSVKRCCKHLNDEVSVLENKTSGQLVVDHVPTNHYENILRVIARTSLISCHSLSFVVVIHIEVFVTSNDKCRMEISTLC